MSARSLNKVILIGNLTRDPELRYTPAGTGVCTFGIATNRTWTTQSGETKEETEFHRIVAWNKLGELCSQLLTKGRKVYVEGRLATHSWTAQDGSQRTTTEIVIEDMIILDSKRIAQAESESQESTAPTAVHTIEKAVESEVKPEANVQKESQIKKKSKKSDEEKQNEQPVANESITPEDIPF